MRKLKIFSLVVAIVATLIFSGCGGGGDDDPPQPAQPKVSYDLDNDFIPDDIEDLIGTDKLNSDQNGNGIVDGIELEGSYGDPFFKYQWYIDNNGVAMNLSKKSPTIGNDLHILDIYHRYMGYNKGNPIKVHVVDSGVDMNHEDIRDNFDLENSYRVDLNAKKIYKNDNPNSVTKETHGTKVAGIIAARAFNGLGVRGVAPFSSISGTNFIQGGIVYPAMLDTVWRDGDIDIFNNSWGSFVIDKLTLYEEYMELGTKDGRSGKGAIYVFSAGNDRQKGGNTNFDYKRGNRFVIPVAALNSKNHYSSYSTPSSNAMVSGYGGEYYITAPTIATTTITGEANASLTWEEDRSLSYTSAMNGTSSAAPTVSGALALVLEACPNLDYRDVKYLIAKTSVKVDPNNSSWTQNSAGFNFSEDYGFGLINPDGIIKECRDNSYINLPTERKITKTFIVNEAIDTSDFSGKWKLYNFEIDSDMTIEWIGVTIDSNLSLPSGLNIHLLSPSKTEIDLHNVFFVSSTQVKLKTKDAWLDGGHRFGVNGFMGEKSKGIWILGISNLLKQNRTGLMKSIKIEIYGH